MTARARARTLRAMRIPESAAFRIGQLDERAARLRMQANECVREALSIRAAFGLPSGTPDAPSVSVDMDNAERPVGLVYDARTGVEWNPPAPAADPAPALAIVPSANGAAAE